MMPMPRTYRERELVAMEKSTRAEMMEATRGLDDCGAATHGKYIRGCRCLACCEANAAYERQRARDRAYGRPSQFVDAEPVRQRIMELRRRGYTVKEIERLAGVGHSTIHGIMVRHWRTGEPVRRCLRGTRDAIMAIGGERRLTKGQRVDASRMRRDLVRWKAAGLSMAHVARRMHLDRQVLYRVINGRSRRVTARTLHAYVVAKGALDAEVGARMPDAMEILGV